MPKIVYDIEFKVKGGASISNALKGVSESSDIESAKKKIQELEAALESAGNEADNFNRKQKRGAGSANKAFSGANQTVFAFNDLIQDSTQFSQGFSQGMRAIGNNVAFAGELFGQLQQRVQNYNDSLTKAEIAAGKQRTVVGELKKSFTGMGAAVFAANAVFLAFQVGSVLVDKALKELEQQAKANAEAFSKVASEFSKFNSGIDDPFGLRARASEISILNDEVKEIDPEKIANVSNQISLGVTNPVGQAIAATANFLGLEESLLSLTTAIGLSSDETYISVQANNELRKELEKAKQTQEAFTQFLERDGNEALRDYVDLTGDASRALVEFKSGTEEGLGSIKETLEVTNDQILSIQNKNTRTQEEIVLLQKLLEVRGKLVNVISREAAIEAQISASKEGINRLSLENDLINERNSFEQLSIEQSLKSNAAREQSQKRLMSIENQRASGRLTDDQAEILMENEKIALQMRLGNIELFYGKQRTMLALELVSSFAQVGGALAEAFGANKKFQIATALVDGGAAIVKTLASTPFPANIAASLGIAARVKRQIEQIKSVNLNSGGGGGVGTSSLESSNAFITRTGEVTPPSFQPLPPNSQNSQPKFIIENKVTPRGLATVVRQGETEIRASQITV